MSDQAGIHQFLEIIQEHMKQHPQIFMKPGRDPARIPVVFDALRKVWERHPDFRLAQLVVNAAGPISDPCPEVFNLEDDALIRGLAQLDAQFELSAFKPEATSGSDDEA